MADKCQLYETDRRMGDESEEAFYSQRIASKWAQHSQKDSTWSENSWIL